MNRGKYITKSELLKKYPTAYCCDCEIEIDQDNGSFMWIVLFPVDRFSKNSLIFYCSKCANYEGWLFERE